MFGFECEYASGVAEITRQLYTKGLAGSAEVHPYHCACLACRFDSGYIFRVQRDSSCDGEIISHVFESTEDARHYMSTLSEIAVEVDAAPTSECGFHVHVDPPESVEDQQKALYTYFHWEDLLQPLAQGRYPYVRDNNQPLRAEYSYRIGAASLFTKHLEADRHSFLNIHTGHGTWEFRLWNGTRSHWRMEMYCMLSEAFCDLAVIDALGTTEIHESKLISALTACGYDPTLVERQFKFYRSGRGTSADFLAA